MTTVLQTWTNKESEQEANKTSETLEIYGYAILHTIELGNVLCTHTGAHGNFLLSTTRVKRLFRDHNCRFTLTCFPAKHYKLRPKTAEQLHILFPKQDRTVLFNPSRYYPDITAGV